MRNITRYVKVTVAFTRLNSLEEDSTAICTPAALLLQGPEGLSDRTGMWGDPQ